MNSLLVLKNTLAMNEAMRGNHQSVYVGTFPQEVHDMFCDLHFKMCVLQMNPLTRRWVNFGHAHDQQQYSTRL